MNRRKEIVGLRKRTHIEGANLFFVTTTLQDHQSLITTPKSRNDFQNLLFEFFPGYADVLMGYVIMPSHIHLLVGCFNGGQQLSRFMQSFKSLSSRKLFPEVGSVWQHRFDDLVITSEKQFQIKRNYIHENPVRKGFVSAPADWEWSSARYWILGEDHPVLTRDWHWMPR